MEPTTHIQNIINARADNKLKAEIKALHEILSNGNGYKLLKEINITVSKNDKITSVNLAWLLSTDSSYYGNEIFEKHKEEYRKQETNLFIQEVAKLNNKVIDLQSQLEDLQNG